MSTETGETIKDGLYAFPKNDDLLVVHEGLVYPFSLSLFTDQKAEEFYYNTVREREAFLRTDVLSYAEELKEGREIPLVNTPIIALL